MQSKCSIALPAVPHRPKLQLLRQENAEYVARLALDPRTQEDAFRIRYESYLSGGFIEPNRTKLFSDSYDFLSNSQTIVIYQFGVPVGSVRNCLLSPHSIPEATSPAAHIYPKDVHCILTRHSPQGNVRSTGVETNRLVRSPAVRDNFGLVFLLYRMAGYIGMVAQADMLLACVRDEHVRFYRRLGFSVETSAQPYPGLSCPMRLMSCPRARYDVTRQHYPILDPFAGTTASLEHFMQGEAVALTIAPEQ